MTFPVTTHKSPETMAHTKPPTTAAAITETLTSTLQSLTSPGPVTQTLSTKISSSFKPSAVPTSVSIAATRQPASTPSLLEEILSEKELLVTDIESVALSETDADVVTLTGLDAVVKTELPSVVEAAEEQRVSLPSSSSTETEIFTETPPLMEPVTHDTLLTSTPRIFAERLNLTNETQTTVLPQNSEVDMSESDTNDFLPISERVSPAMPSENRISDEAAQLAPQETEEVELVENDNSTFSAAALLSGDGESDSYPSVYLHHTDIDADYQFDSADLLVSPNI